MLKKLRGIKDFRIMVFTIINAVIAFFIAQLAAPQYAEYSLVLIPFLNIISKWLNVKLLGDVGVKKDETVK